MFTILLIAGLAVVLVVSAGLALRIRQEAAAREGEELARRFGPEYDRVLARHQGDVRTTGRELRGRLKRYAGLPVLPLNRADRERYLAQWGALQEEFTTSPHRALDAAEALLTELATERGYPAEVSYEERIAALSVHHARRVHGYRRAHEVCAAAPRGADSTTPDGVTEDTRAALLEARALFDSLLNARPTSTPPAVVRRTAGAVRPQIG